MTPIKDITGLPQEFKRLEREKNLKKVKDFKESKASEVGKEKTGKIAKDKVMISKMGKSLLKRKEEISQYLKHFNNIKTLDEKTLSDIKQKIQSDYYSKPQVQSKIAETISNLPSFRNTSSKTSSKSEKIKEIQKKIKDGKYNSEVVLDVIAQHILDSLHL